MFVADVQEMVSVPGAKCFLDMDMLLDFRKKHHTKMMWQSVSDILLHVTPFGFLFLERCLVHTFLLGVHGDSDANER